MSISLFEHNRVAYEAAVSLFTESGKAAIVHPTGTGKSFIGFQLCEDYPDSTVCWLSPSEYIFQTQLENLVATGAERPENILFFTYAKLMLMDDAALSELHPDFIVLDEFHRCGAEQWGKGVQSLLDMYPNTPILGLSATNIRYLDNQRDMADELFDGNIASEMTLGEAIVRGILNPPKYILSVYSYQKELDKYQSRVRRAKSKVVRDSAQKQLDALRRALTQADGLDVIFQKHMTDRTGKYIVFCANLEHMDEMIAHVSEWFSKVDESPRVYRAYSDDPETSQSFAAFKADQSEHLKLLFCIDMLNEGVHVEDISGVILFRPTVSPIIYKQQIGRALCASKRKEPIIFDIVNNFENLYSIGAIEQEMQAAISYYRFSGEAKEIVTDRFQIIDEIRNCRELFDAMNDTLTASWDMMYAEAKKYYVEHGNLEVPKRHKTAQGYSLGSWLHTQRKVHSGEIFGKLDEKRIAKLDAIGMVWGSFRDLAWERNFAAAEQYFDAYGNLDTNVNYVTPDGFRLGSWICQLRSYRKSGIQSNYLTEKRMAQLDALGMIWDVPDYLWEQNYAAALAYYKKQGNLDVPYRYVSEDGLRLGTWIRRMRGVRSGTMNGAVLTEEQIHRLDSVGMLWDDKYARQWEIGFAHAQSFYEAHGNLNTPTDYCTPSGFPLGAWLANHREQGGTKITPQRKARLDAIGMVWQKPDSWELRYGLVQAYFEEHGDLKIPADYVADDIWLGKWLNEQKQVYHGKRRGKALTPSQIQRLEQLGMDWLSPYERIWENNYADAVKVYEATGDATNAEGVLSDLGAFRRWINTQRRAFRDGKLSKEQISKLDAIQFPWELEDHWEQNYALLQDYRLKNGGAKIPSNLTAPDGTKLYAWLSNQKHKCSGKNRYGVLSEQQLEKLNRLEASPIASERREQR